MKIKTFFLLVALSLFVAAGSSYAQDKEQIKCKYVVKKLKLDKARAAKFSPICLNYFKELAAAKSQYKALKDKMKSSIKSGKLSDAQADQLMDAHWASDARETAVKKKYAEIFKQSIGAKMAFEAFDYASDSMKKMSGGSKKKSSDDDDE